MHPDFMFSRMGRTTLACVFVVVALALAACGGKQAPTPTPRPIPTATPTAIELPTPTPTVDVVYEYDKATIAVTSDYSRAAYSLQDLLDAAAKSPGLFTESAWRAMVEENLAKYDASVADARAIVAPPQFELAHQEFLLAADGVNRYTALVRQAFSENNVALIADSTQAIREAMRHLEAYQSLNAAAR